MGDSVVSPHLRAPSGRFHRWLPQVDRERAFTPPTPLFGERDRNRTPGGTRPADVMEILEKRRQWRKELAKKLGEEEVENNNGKSRKHKVPVEKELEGPGYTHHSSPVGKGNKVHPEAPPQQDPADERRGPAHAFNEPEQWRQPQPQQYRGGDDE